MVIEQDPEQRANRQRQRPVIINSPDNAPVDISQRRRAEKENRISEFLKSSLGDDFAPLESEEASSELSSKFEASPTLLKDITLQDILVYSTKRFSEEAASLGAMKITDESYPEQLVETCKWLFYRDIVAESCMIPDEAS